MKRDIRRSCFTHWFTDFMYDFNHSIIDIAKDFYEAYCRCTRGETQTHENNSCSTSVVNIPAIVNGAFSIELYLKYIISISTKKYTSEEHNLKRLFKMLARHDQDYMKNRIEGNLLHCGSFNKCLHGISNSFVYWRYIHEKRDFGFGLNMTIIAINCFLNCIKEYAENYKK